MGPSNCLRSSYAILFLFTIMVVFSHNTNNDTVSYAKTAHRAQIGIMQEWECTDSMCQSCHRTREHQIHFGKCLSSNTPEELTGSEMWRCFYDSVMFLEWNNDRCEGYPIVRVMFDECDADDRD